MPKTKLISSMLSVCMSVNLLSSSMIQSTYIVSNAISLNDMDFTIRSGTTDELILNLIGVLKILSLSRRMSRGKLLQL